MSWSYTDVLTAQRCLKKFEYAAIRKLQRKTKAVNQTEGTLTHRFLMDHYLGLDLDNTYDELLAEATKYLFADEITNGVDLVDSALDRTERYLAHYRDDEWEILHVEEQFTATTEDGVEITFTPDLVIRDASGVWVVDHKITDKMPQGGLPVGNLQSFVYSAVIREVYPDFKGFIFNHIRKKMPTQPRLTKTGDLRVADLARIDTTFEILRDFLLENAPQLLEDEAHVRRLAELKDNPRYFAREYIFATEEMTDQIMREVEFTVGTIERAVEQGMYPRHFLPYAGAQECEKCPFQDLCVAELRGYNTETIMFLYEERDMSHKEYDYEESELL